MTYKVFADANVYLDFLLHRGTEWREAERLFQLAIQRELELFTSASNLLNIMYIMDNYKLTKSEIIMHASAILQYSRLANPDNSLFKSALASGFNDLEDAVQYYTALHIEGINYFITSNTRDFKKASTYLPVLTPKEFMQLYEKGG